jgi:transcription initiation factor TFIIIB Brf1 subunit/transcription initiation factor TFIIB
MYKVKVNNGSKGILEFNMIKKDESCPICGQKLGGFSWNMFHGEVTSSCCGCILQFKSYYAGDDATEEYKNFVESIGTNDVGYIFQIDEEWIEPLKRAINDTGIYNIQNDEVFDKAKAYKDETK